MAPFCSPMDENGLYRPFRANYAARGFLLLRRRLLRSLELDVAPFAHGDLCSIASISPQKREGALLCWFQESRPKRTSRPELFLADSAVDRSSVTLALSFNFHHLAKERFQQSPVEIGIRD